MKIIRFQDSDGVVHYGEYVDDQTAHLLEGDIFHDFEVTNRRMVVSQLLAPVEPKNILCIGLNYRQHAEETGAKLPENPVLFIKAVNALNHPGAPIDIPKIAPGQVDYECELAVVIKKPAKNVSKNEALDYVLGYTCANDVSARRWQKEGGAKQWCRGKSFDTFCPLGPCLVTPEDIPNPNKLRICTTINGVVMQDSSTSDMIFDVPTLISFLSEGTTLLPGTVILTGTPQGVGFARNPPIFLKAGDEVEIEIEDIGVLRNPVQEEK
ncbi:fumarylacetoacetate hydrolase family protein [Candidatus Nitronereus thalassa]|uniref:Fumarylacetoacetate hydrolase family protein n=1 Tax=Candidatus Nitronereus thalassa TaxID=3020898 RepID=A0ABU3K4L6_9BACT|nr:fumarylacetoacetate hydrolase family protein [Candidatus Nitronereus thalassa]MDT7041335.1 fumarylacetoacetate hydrolase family protein [Candidatus Nitronereus thalassa]